MDIAAPKWIQKYLSCSLDPTTNSEVGFVILELNVGSGEQDSFLKKIAQILRIVKYMYEVMIRIAKNRKLILFKINLESKKIIRYDYLKY